jgi:hypothetical protein
MPLFIHNNETLRNAAYCLEEHAFFQCKLTNSTLVYSGDSFEFQNLQLESIANGKFRNDAAMTPEGSVTHVSGTDIPSLMTAIMLWEPITWICH